MSRDFTEVPIGQQVVNTGRDMTDMYRERAVEAAGDFTRFVNLLLTDPEFNRSILSVYDKQADSEQSLESALVILLRFLTEVELALPPENSLWMLKRIYIEYAQNMQIEPEPVRIGDYKRIIEEVDRILTIVHWLDLQKHKVLSKEMVLKKIQRQQTDIPIPLQIVQLVLILVDLRILGSEIEGIELARFLCAVSLIMMLVTVFENFKVNARDERFRAAEADLARLMGVTEITPQLVYFLFYLDRIIHNYELQVVPFEEAIEG